MSKEFEKEFSPMPAEDRWRDKASALEGEIQELKLQLYEKQTVINLTRTESNRWRDDFLEAKERLTALLMAIDAQELAKVHHGIAVTKAWAYHWRRAKNED